MKLNPKHVLITGKISRNVNGARIRLKAGDVFRPTDTELESFGDLMEQVDPTEKAIYIDINRAKIDITIVTSLYGDYGKYLAEWTESICTLTAKPAAVVIVLSGINDIRKTNYPADKIFTEECAPRFKQADIPYQLVQIEKHVSMGHARNQAVAHASSEWVQYLDVDDVVLPNCLTDVAKAVKMAQVNNMGTVDVVSIGVKYGGNYKNKKPDFFLDASAQKALMLPRQRVSTSLSPYRRALWEKRPYIEDPGVAFIDGALWIGFAHLGAKFLGINNVCAEYRLRKNGHFYGLTPEERALAIEQLSELIKDEGKFAGYYEGDKAARGEGEVDKVNVEVEEPKKPAQPAQPATATPATATPAPLEPPAPPAQPAPPKPKHIGGGVYELFDGSRVRGKVKAQKATEKLCQPACPDHPVHSGLTTQPDQPAGMLDNREEALIKIANTLRSCKLTWFITNGTCLGAVREGDFIKHDGDMDITLLSEQWPNAKRKELAGELVKQGFEYKFNHTTDHMRFKYKGGWLCLYFYRLRKSDARLRVASSSAWASEEATYYVPAALFEVSDTAQIRGKAYPVPSPVKLYLEWQYGDGWRTPNKVKGYQNFAEKRTCYKAEALKYADEFIEMARELRG